MKTKINLLLAAALCALLLSCGSYTKYESTTQVPTDVYGKDTPLIDNAIAQPSIAQLSWRDFFSDPQLQTLIDTALQRNTDLKAAQIRVEQAQLSLKVAKMANLPSISLSPSAGIGTTGSTIITSYDLKADLQMQIDAFGSLASTKHNAQALKMQTECAQQLTQVQLIASIAQAYNQLQLLDRQLQIMQATEQLWAKSLETQRALMENGKAYSTSVQQMEASYLGVKSQILDVQNNILDVQNTICLLLDQTPRHIPRSAWDKYQLPQRIGIGLPAELLTNRPDVRMAEYGVEASHYNVKAARAAFYPNITLGGSTGWSYNRATINPGQWILSTAASLVQPIFSQGKIRARYKNAQLEQQNAINHLSHTILQAGNEANKALRLCQLDSEKDQLYKQQVAVLQKAYNGTHELMHNGKASYLEVLTAQEALLNAQLNEATNLFNGYHSLITLYCALGGGQQ